MKQTLGGEHPHYLVGCIYIDFWIKFYNKGEIMNGKIAAPSPLKILGTSMA